MLHLSHRYYYKMWGPSHNKLSFLLFPMWVQNFKVIKNSYFKHLFFSQGINLKVFLLRTHLDWRNLFPFVMQEITKFAVEEDILLSFMSRQVYFLCFNILNNETSFWTEGTFQIERIETFVLRTFSLLINFAFENKKISRYKNMIWLNWITVKSYKK